MFFTKGGWSSLPRGRSIKHFYREVKKAEERDRRERASRVRRVLFV